MSLYSKRSKNKIKKNPIDSDLSDCENRDNDQLMIENIKPQQDTARGNLAALISNLDNSDSDDSDSDLIKSKSKGGLYARRLNQTKKERKNINYKFFESDSKSLLINFKFKK